MKAKTISQSREVLGSVIEIKLLEQHKSFFSLCFSELQRIDETYSRFRADSELSKVNNELGKWHKVSEEFLFLVSKLKEFNERTDGNFDATLKKDIERLGYDSKYSFSEKKSSHVNLINTLLDKVFEPISVDFKRKRLKIRKEIELGGFGKGMALDKVSAILEKNGVKHYYLNAGGDVYAKRDEKYPAWEILLEHPDNSNKAIGRIELNGQAIACSAPNRRKWKTPEGKTYHHLLNAKTRMPQSSVKSIFVLAKSGMEADGYATALFCAGFDEAIRLSAKLPVKIIVVSQNDKMFVSDKFPVEFYK